MENQNTALKKFEAIAQKLDANVIQVIGSEKLNGFAKAFLVATATQELKNLLTDEYMKPIMALQSNRLGFKTDKDKDGGYNMNVVRDCLIEAVLTGVQPVGNQFNIIQSTCYITKEGFGYLLPKVPGLEYQIIPSLPRINNEKTGAAVQMKIRWRLGNGEWQERDIDFAIKMNNMMGTDAVIGKATRKARAWLYHTVTGVEIGDGDVQDADVTVLSSKTNVNHEADRVKQMIETANELSHLTPEIEQLAKENNMQALFNSKYDELGGK